MFAKITSFIISVIMFICSFFGINLGGKEVGKDMIEFSKSKSVITIALKENGTTGYRWVQKTDDESIIKLTKDNYLAPLPNGMVGAPGTRVFTFEAKSAGKTKIVFSYERDWEDGSAETLTLNVEVDENMKITAEFE